MPDENTHFITEVVEIVMFVYPASPNTQHVDITFFSQLQAVTIIFFGNVGKGHIGSNPIGTFSEELPIINTEDKRVSTIILWLLDEFNFSNS